MGVSFLAFNYRGVARSMGTLETSDDLVTDGAAAIDYLLRQGVSSKNISFYFVHSFFSFASWTNYYWHSKILLHGHSMGGAVATKIRAMYPDGPIINDRSFKSLNHVVLVWSPISSIPYLFFTNHVSPLLSSHSFVLISHSNCVLFLLC